MFLQGSKTSTDAKVGGGRLLAGGAKGREVETGAVALVRLITPTTLLDCFGRRKKEDLGNSRGYKLAIA